jgi:hypothetical protein
MAPTASEERMSALEGLNVLDDAAGASLDRLIELATYALDAPVAFVSLVDADKQRLISHRGLVVADTAVRDLFFFVRTVRARRWSSGTKGHY